MFAWYLALREKIDAAHLQLWSEKAHAPTSSEWERELKYQLRAFRSGAAIIDQAKPEPDETRERYLLRVAPLLEVVPDSVPHEDLDAWRAGRRELARAFGETAADPGQPLT